LPGLFFDFRDFGATNRRIEGMNGLVFEPALYNEAG
jgi:hypothetical protein